MARRAGLIALAAAVAALHLAGIDWVARAIEAPSLLQKMAPPMFTRLLEQEAPAVAPPPAVRAPRKRPPPAEGSMAASLPAPSVPAADTPTVAPPEPEVAAAPQSIASAPASVASQPAMAAAAPANAASAPGTALGDWPADTRLAFHLTGDYRGPLYGDARVQWQRDDAGQYQVKLEIDITPWVSLAITSQGRVTEQGLLPRAYEESRRGKRRNAELGEQAITLENGRVTPRPEGVQDTVSQFVELSHRFRTGRDVLEPGRSVSFWLARPGGVDLWTYDIVERVTLDAGRLGMVDAWHLRPRPIANPRGNITAEMWFAPSLQYLPVRIKVNVGEAWVDLMVEKIEQR